MPQTLLPRTYLERTRTSYDRANCINSQRLKIDLQKMLHHILLIGFLKSLISPSPSFFKVISYEGPDICDIHTKRRWGGLEICHVFMDSIDFKQQIYCSFLRTRGGSKKLVIFCRRHNCITPDVKKVTFLVLVPVLTF